MAIHILPEGEAAIRQVFLARENWSELNQEKVMKWILKDFIDGTAASAWIIEEQITTFLLEKIPFSREAMFHRMCYCYLFFSGYQELNIH